MQREIKFRAWNQDEQEFQYFVFSQGGHWSHSIKAYSTNAVQEWQQYIGGKDSDGREIYEDDILAYRDGEFSYDAIVKWDDEGLRYYMEGIEPVDNFNFEDIPASSHRVIGNIRENPGLLK